MFSSYDKCNYIFLLPQLTALLSEKEDKIGHLQERTQTLEQRLQDGSLSGDDRVTALEKEVLHLCLTTRNHNPSSDAHIDLKILSAFYLLKCAVICSNGRKNWFW